MSAVRRLGVAAFGIMLAAVVVACPPASNGSFGRLARAIEPVARDVGVREAATRETRGGQVAGHAPEQYARVDGTIRGVPEDVFARLRASLEDRGFTMVEGPSRSHPFLSRWRKGGIEVDAAVEGASGYGEQSLEVSLEARSR